MFEHKLFEYKIELPTEDGSGTEWVTLRFKQLTQIPLGVLRKHRKDPEAQMWATLEWGLSADQMETFDRVPMGEIEKLMEAWSEDDGKGVPLGESDASSPSSIDTARRSKRTSSSTDSG